jgi:replicative DNA helicase
MSGIERLPPHSMEAEEAVLGSLLIDPDAIFDVASLLKPESFYRVQNRWIYECILEPARAARSAGPDYGYGGTAPAG